MKCIKKELYVCTNVCILGGLCVRVQDVNPRATSYLCVWWSLIIYVWYVNRYVGRVCRVQNFGFRVYVQICIYVR